MGRYTGRFCNQLVRNLAASLYAEQHNLYITYQNLESMEKLGIPLFSGENKYGQVKYLTDQNYFQENVDCNIITKGYFQTKKITDKIHEYLNSRRIMHQIINNNKFKNRYNDTDDCFVHVRLGDVSKYNPGFEYYDSVLSNLTLKSLYVATDSPDHEIIQRLREKYPTFTLLDFKEVSDIILFGSTCKHVVLSYGTFSAIIGYLSFFSDVHHLRFCEENAWDWNAEDECDMFRDKSTCRGKWTAHY
jgi:hypothetical protein